MSVATSVTSWSPCTRILGVHRHSSPQVFRDARYGNPVGKRTVFVTSRELLLGSERRPPPTTRSHSMTDHDPFADAPPEPRELLALASDLALQAGRIHAAGRRQRPHHRDQVVADGSGQPGRQGGGARSSSTGSAPSGPTTRLLGEEGSRWRARAACAGSSTLSTAPPTTSTATPRTRRPSRWRSTADGGSASSWTRARGGCTGPSPGRRRLRRPALSTRACPRFWRRLSSRRGSRTTRATRAEGAVVAAVLPRIRDIRRGGYRRARLVPPRRRRGRRLLGARPLAVGLRGRHADRPRGRRRGATCAVRRRQGPRRGRHARVAHAGVPRAAARRRRSGHS